MIMNRFSVVRFNNKFDRGGDVTLCNGCERCERGALLQISIDAVDSTKSHSRVQLQKRGRAYQSVTRTKENADLRFSNPYR